MIIISRKADWSAQDDYFANPSGTLTLQTGSTDGDTTTVDGVDWREVFSY